MDIKKIVVEVLASMGSGTGQARSEDLLFTKILEKHHELLDHQVDLRNAIKELINEGIIIHDSKMKYWIRLNNGGRK